METSFEGLEGLSSWELFNSLVNNTSGPLFLTKSSGSAAGITFLEFSNDLSFLWDLNDGFRFAFGSELVTALVGLTGHLTLLFSFDKFS